MYLVLILILYKFKSDKKVQQSTWNLSETQFMEILRLLLVFHFNTKDKYNYFFNIW